MIKHAIVLASVLVLAACQSARNGNEDNSSAGTSGTGSNTGSTGYEQSSPSTTTAPSGSFGSTSLGSTIPAERETMIPPGSSPSSGTIGGTAGTELGGTGLNRQNPPSSSTESTDDRTEINQSPTNENRQLQSDTAVDRRPDSGSAGNAADVPAESSTASSALGTQAGTAAPGQTGTGSLSGTSAADRAITQSVTNSLMVAGVPAETMNTVQVRTTNGRVILSGQVKTQAEKQRIENQVRQTPGVRTIINQLRVVSSPSDSNPETQIDDSGAIPGNRTLPGSSAPANSGTGSGSSTTVPQ